MFLVTARINFYSLEIKIIDCACAHLSKVHEGSERGDLERF